MSMIFYLVPKQIDHEGHRTAMDKAFTVAQRLVRHLKLEHEGNLPLRFLTEEEVASITQGNIMEILPPEYWAAFQKMTAGGDNIDGLAFFELLMEAKLVYCFSDLASFFPIYVNKEDHITETEARVIWRLTLLELHKYLPLGLFQLFTVYFYTLNMERIMGLIGLAADRGVPPQIEIPITITSLRRDTINTATVRIDARGKVILIKLKYQHGLIYWSEVHDATVAES